MTLTAMLEKELADNPMAAMKEFAKYWGTEQPHPPVLAHMGLAISQALKAYITEDPTRIDGMKQIIPEDALKAWKLI